MAFTEGGCVTAEVLDLSALRRVCAENAVTLNRMEII